MATLPIIFNDNDKIAIIAPHPDDECIGAGGIMAKYPSQCDVFVVTDGRRGNKNVSPDAEALIRKEQFENEMKFANINSFSWLGYEDGALMSSQDDFLSGIDFSQYTKIFIPWGNDNHADHAAVYACALCVLREQDVDAEVYQYEVHVPFHDITHYVDITDILDKKVAMISYHKDQIDALPYHKISSALAKYRACQGNHSEEFWETFLFTNIRRETGDKEMILREKTLQKYQSFYRLLLRWLKANIKSDNSVVEYLIRQQYRNVSIYGFAELGRLLFEALNKGGICVVNILDSRTDLLSPDETHKVLQPENGNNNVDVVIVTAITYFSDIEVRLKKLGYKNIISLQTLVEAIA